MTTPSPVSGEPAPSGRLEDPTDIVGHKTISDGKGGHYHEPLTRAEGEEMEAARLGYAAPEPIADERVTEEELRRAVQLLGKQLLNVDMTMSQHREFARAILRFFRQRPAVKMPTTEEMAQSVAIFFDAKERWEWNEVVDFIYTTLFCTGRR